MSHIVSVRLSDEQHRTFKREAEREGVSLSAYLRRHAWRASLYPLRTESATANVSALNGREWYVRASETA